MEYLTSEQQAALAQKMQRGSFAYVRNLAAAEQVVRRGQFNVAKVLRAVAIAKRTIALHAARLLEAATMPTATALLSTNLTGQQNLLASSDEVTKPGAARQTLLDRSSTVHERVANLLQRSLDSLAEYPDILVSVVPTSIFGCRNCGNPMEGAQLTHCQRVRASRSG